MQNTILIHAPVRRQGRGALVLAYTALFALLMGIWAAIFALNGQSFFQYGDTLKQHYPFLVYYGRWLRQAARCVLTGAAVPTWGFSIGYGADENGKVIYTEQVPEIAQEPNYTAAIDALK